MQRLTAQSGKSLDLALLGGLCFFLSALEHLIPKPLPFMRIGLANLPLLIALDIFSVKHFFLLALIKVLGQGLITGTLFSFTALFSITGTGLSAALMFMLRKAGFSRYISLVGISLAGAFVSNAAQLVLARFLVFGEGVLYLAPIFLAAGIISGGLLGFAAETFSAQSQWLRLKREGAASHADSPEQAKPLLDASCTPAFAPAATPMTAAEGNITVLFRGIVLLLLALLFLFIPSLPVRAALFLLFWLWAILAGKKTRPLFTIITIIIITICNLFPPFGKILFSYGPFIIAQESLMRGLQRAVTMEGLVMFSRLVLAAAIPLPGKLRHLAHLIKESFGVLEELNSAFPKKNKITGIRSVMQNIDKMLCKKSPPVQ